jgi:hypothetical protein
MSERGHLQVDIGGNASGFRQALNGIRQQARQFSREVGAGFEGAGKGFFGGIIGALSIEGMRAVSGKIMASFGNFVQKASGISNLAEQMNMGTDETQKWAKAVDDLNLSFGGLQAVLATIEQTRTEALTDRKARDKYSALGIDIMGQRDTGNSDFAQMVFDAGAKDDAGRAAFIDLLGKRAGKFIPIGNAYAKAKAPISEEAIGAGKEAQRAERELSNLWTTLWGRLVTTVVKTAKTFGEASVPGARREASIRRAVADLAFDPYATKPAKAGGLVEDPLETAELAADVKGEGEWKDKHEQAEDRLREIQLKNMGASARRASLQTELATVDSKIKNLAPFLDILGESDKTRLAGYRIQHETLTGELRDTEEKHTKPPMIGSDALAKVGLFSASALNMIGTPGPESAQLVELKGIRKAIEAHRDPHGL